MAVEHWNIDPTHSHIEFSIRHLMISSVKGRFGEFTGTVQVDPAAPTAAKVDLTIQVASIDTRQADRDAHLKSPDFFDVATYPTIVFKSKSLKGDPTGDFTLVGELTMHGVTKPVELAATAEGRGKDPWGNERAGFSATTKVDRREFGLVWNQALETGGVAVGHEVKVSLDLEVVLVPAAQAVAAGK
jgi:polyisoprenoid-binding protein YceI